MVPVFMDLDPDQGIEEPYKNKHNQLFCWRALRSLAEVDLKNFSGEGQPQKNRNRFEFGGNIEEQAQLLLNTKAKAE